MIKPLARPLLFIAPLLLGGCISSILPDAAPPNSIYRLTEQTLNVTPNADAIVYRVDRPTAPQALSGQDIIVSPNARELNSAQGARWAENVPILIQSAMLAELGQRKDIIGVEPVSGARSDNRLHITVRDFEARFDNGPESPPLAIVHYGVTVSNAASRKLLGTYDVRKTHRSNEVRVSAIVDAQDKANREALSDIADWLSSLNEGRT